MATFRENMNVPFQSGVTDETRAGSLHIPSFAGKIESVKVAASSVISLRYIL